MKINNSKPTNNLPITLEHVLSFIQVIKDNLEPNLFSHLQSDLRNGLITADFIGKDLTTSTYTKAVMHLLEPGNIIEVGLNKSVDRIVSLTLQDSDSQTKFVIRFANTEPLEDRDNSSNASTLQNEWENLWPTHVVEDMVPSLEPTTDWNQVKIDSFELASSVGDKARDEVANEMLEMKSLNPGYYWSHLAESAATVSKQNAPLKRQYRDNHKEASKEQLFPISSCEGIQAILNDGSRRISDHVAKRAKTSPLMKLLPTLVTKQEILWVASVYHELLSDSREADSEILHSLLSLAWPYTEEMTRVEAYFQTQAGLLFQMLSKESELTQIHLRDVLETCKDGDNS